jgi:hypothetical protein
MNHHDIKANLTELIQHPRAPLVVGLLGLMLLITLVMSWWQWQTDSHKALMQAMNQQQQLQTIMTQLPANGVLVVGSEAMMATLSRHPLPASLQGKVSDIRIVNDQLKGQINQANATELFHWLSQLSQAGLLVATLELSRTELGLVSGSLIWGSL